MNFIFEFIPENIIEAIGWTIFHSVWQGILIAVILGVSVLTINNRNSRFRYALGITSLLLMFISSIITFSKVYQPSADSFQAETNYFQIHEQTKPLGLNPDNISKNTFSFYSALSNIKQYFSNHLSFIVAVWFAGLMILSIRFFGGLIYVRRLKTNGIFPIDEELSRISKLLLKKMNFAPRVEIFYSTLVKIPIALGYLKPMILLPLSFASGLSQSQIETIIVHEIAHLKRNDFIFNIMQIIAETLFFYHPAAWWISSVIRRERENCCDDFTIEICGDPIEYSKALLNIQQQSGQNSSFALAASGNESNLFRRIKRMNEMRKNQMAYGVKFTAFALLAVFIGVVSLYSENTYGSDPKNVNMASFINPFTSLDKSVGDNSLSSITIRDSINLRKGKHTFKFYENENGERKKFKAKLKDGKLEDLFIDGEQIQEDQLSNYQNKIDQKLDDYESVLAEFRKNREEYKKLNKDYAFKLKEFRNKLKDYRNYNSDWNFSEELSSPDLSELRESLHELQYELFENYADNSFEMPPIPPIPPINIPEIDIPEIQIPPISIPPIHIDADNFSGWNSGEWNSDLKEKMDSLKETLKNTPWNNEEFKEDMKEFRKKMKANKREMDSFKDSMKVFSGKMKIFGVEMKKFGKFIKAAKNEMINDGIIESGGDIDSFYLSENKMEVNSKVVLPELRKKYIDLYEEYTGKKMTGDHVINIDNWD